MCSLPATGADGQLWVLLFALAVAALVGGVVLIRRSRAGIALLVLATLLGLGVAGPAPTASAACPAESGESEPPPAPTATIGLIVGDQIFAFTGPLTTTVDVENLSSTTTALAVTLVGIPSGWTVDDSACAAILPGGTCSLVVAISGAATTGVWPYTVAGSNTNAVADSISLLALTTLSVSPAQGDFVVPGDATPFTVTNTGSVDAVLVMALLSGSDPDAYVVGADTCGSTLPPAASCVVSVTFLGASGSGEAVLEVSAVNAATVAAPLVG